MTDFYDGSIMGGMTELEFPGRRIVQFFHCDRCGSGELTTGWTIEGLQVYCEDCRLNVVDIDFKGQKVKVS